MFTQGSSAARRAQQYLSLLRRLNTCTGPGKVGSFSSENLPKSPLFSSENDRGFSGNDVLPRALVPLHLQTGFRYFSANPLQFCESQDDEFSELDAKETKEAEGSKVEISSQWKTIDVLFREAMGLDEISETKRLALDVEGLSDLPPEEQVEKLKSKLQSQSEIINKLRENVDDLEMKIKELNRKHASLVNSMNQKAQRFAESKKSSIDNNTEGVPSLTSVFSKEEKMRMPSLTSIFSKEEKKSESSIDNNTEGVSSLTSIFSKEQKKSVKAEQKKKKMKMQKKAEGVSGSLEHPWPEWVQFLEHLNERGYLSKALNFPGGPVDLRGLSTEELYAFIKFAAVNFAKDHPEISKLLSGSDVRKTVLFGCPSVEIKVVLAAKRLRSFRRIEDTANGPINLENTNNAPSAKVSKGKSLELEDLVRLLCAFGLNAEKSQLSVPDETKQSVVNLLKELIDFSSSSVNDG